LVGIWEEQNVFYIHGNKRTHSVLRSLTCFLLVFYLLFSSRLLPFIFFSSSNFYFLLVFYLLFSSRLLPFIFFSSSTFYFLFVFYLLSIENYDLRVRLETFSSLLCHSRPSGKLNTHPLADLKPAENKLRPHLVA
jgi:hypothetical protein